MTKPFVSGELIVACSSMRAWESPYERGKDGQIINEGQMVLYLSTIKTDGNKQRFIVLFEGRLSYFSCDIRHCNRNWKTLQDFKKWMKMTTPS